MSAAKAHRNGCHPVRSLRNSQAFRGVYVLLADKISDDVAQLLELRHFPALTMEGQQHRLIPLGVLLLPDIELVQHDLRFVPACPASPAVLRCHMMSSQIIRCVGNQWRDHSLLCRGSSRSERLTRASKLTIEMKAARSHCSLSCHRGTASPCSCTGPKYSQLPTLGNTCSPAARASQTRKHYRLAPNKHRVTRGNVVSCLLLCQRESG